MKFSEIPPGTLFRFKFLSPIFLKIRIGSFRYAMLRINHPNQNLSFNLRGSYLNSIDEISAYTQNFDDEEVEVIS